MSDRITIPIIAVLAAAVCLAQDTTAPPMPMDALDDAVTYALTTDPRVDDLLLLEATALPEEQMEQVVRGICIRSAEHGWAAGYVQAIADAGVRQEGLDRLAYLMFTLGYSDRYLGDKRNVNAAERRAIRQMMAEVLRQPIDEPE
jgi:hypothetical protein